MAWFYKLKTSGSETELSTCYVSAFMLANKVMLNSLKSCLSVWYALSTQGESRCISLQGWPYR